MHNDYLYEIVNCPRCGKPVMNGDRIWINGECLCPQCYMDKRVKLDKERNKSND